MSWIVLVVAKAPIVGRVKTRLCPPLTYEAAADLAAASLLDTLSTAAVAVGGDHRRLVLALDGDLHQGARSVELVEAIAGWTVIQQRGGALAERLADAHCQVGALHPGAGVVQVGMDTPQVAAAQWLDAAQGLEHYDAVLGEADDGGWWLLALRDPTIARVLIDVSMSRETTARDTRAALARSGAAVGTASSARDIDYWPDAIAAARLTPGSHLGVAVSSLVEVLV